MKNKLIEYGFQDWQVIKLLKNKKLDTMHGVYSIKKDNLYLNDKKKMSL